MPFEIITAAEAAVELGVSVDARLTRLVEAVHADFYAQTGRTFEKKERTIYVPGYGLDYLFITETPVSAIAEVRIDATGVLGADTAVENVATTFVTNDETFTLRYLNGFFPEGPRVAMVRFTAGYNTWASSGGTAPMPPQDMRDGLLEEVFARYRRGTGEQFQSVSISGTESFSRFREGHTDGFRRAVRRYKRPV